MIYKFTILSDEVEDFVRVISIDAEASFLDFHHAILDSCQYTKDMLTTFFICSDDWEKEQEVTLIEMDTGSEYDDLVMEDTKLEDLINDEKQKLMYVFDLLSERTFFMEVTEIIPGVSSSHAECILSRGHAPAQILLEDDVIITPDINVDASFYGDTAFDENELDDVDFDDAEPEPDELNFDDNSFFDDSI